MDEDTLNLEVRSFLKEFGVTAQRELETAIHDAVEAGDLDGDEALDATATLRVEAIGLEHEVADAIELDRPRPAMPAQPASSGLSRSAVSSEP